MSAKYDLNVSFRTRTMSAQGREGRNRSDVEAAMPGRLRGDERSARSSRTGIHRIATSGKIISTLAAIVTVGQERASSLASGSSPGALTFNSFSATHWQVIL